ncbi:di-heme oxidoredictase family protein [Gemmata sp.]|uniref:di-heme oxidoredictase family protein n=1 Tax=Gemmata sp. TaxID=1914242 RepID=UPI003F6FAA6F
MRLTRLTTHDQRRLVGFGLVGAAAVAVYAHFFFTGLPILWGPRASAAETAEGRELFEHEWEPNDPLAQGDGLGPVFNARSCAACHFQGGLGGGGGLEHNVTAFEVFPRPGDPTFRSGVVHNFSAYPGDRETLKGLRRVYPTVKGRVVPPGPADCGVPRTIPDFDPVRTEEIQATALFGVGWIDLIPDRAVVLNARNRGLRQARRELQLEFDSVPVGRVRHVAGGVGKFGWKGQFATLSEFVAAACANELGLGTPTAEQARPFTAPASGAPAPDLDRKQFRALVAFVKTLPRPIEVEPLDAAARDSVARGKRLFGAVGCAVCHVPDLGGVKGVYSDFMLYTLEDPPPPGGGSGRYDPDPPAELRLPPRPDDEPRPAEWKTPPLWGVADSAPYLHDGSAATLRDAVLKHLGDAKGVTEKFKALSTGDQAALVAFLGSLKAPPDALPMSNPAVTRLAKK